MRFHPRFGKRGLVRAPLPRPCCVRRNSPTFRAPEPATFAKIRCAPFRQIPPRSLPQLVSSPSLSCNRTILDRDSLLQQRLTVAILRHESVPGALSPALSSFPCPLRETAGPANPIHQSSPPPPPVA